jgi:hypothetical protein
MQVFESVSAMAVTWYPSPEMDSTVRHTPSCERLWSTFSSGARGEKIRKVLLDPRSEMEEIVPVASIIPVNML